MRPDAPSTAIPTFVVIETSANRLRLVVTEQGPREKPSLAGPPPIAYLNAQRSRPMAKNKFHDARGPSQRQLRVGELIRRTLSRVLMQGDVHDPELNAMSITVGEVRTSPDLKIATVYVMPLGGKNRDEAIQALSRNRGELRRELMKDMTLKYAPDLRFVIDETFDQMDETRRLFAQDAVRRDLETGDNADGDG
jgi:ribosome-binding factor A